MSKIINTPAKKMIVCPSPKEQSETQHTKAKQKEADKAWLHVDCFIDPSQSYISDVD